VVAVKVHAELFAAALSKLSIMEAGEGGKDGDLQTQRRGYKSLPECWVEGIVGGCGPDGATKIHQRLCMSALGRLQAAYSMFLINVKIMIGYFIQTSGN
jgi:hypothetical protein